MRIHETVKQLEQEVFEYLRKRLDENYEIIRDYKSFWGYCYDIAVLRNRVVVAVFEIKQGAIVYGKNPMLFDTMNSRRRSVGARYLVVTDGDEYCVFSDESYKPIIVNAESFIDCLLKEYPIATSEPDLSGLVNRIVNYGLESQLIKVVKYVEKKGSKLFRTDPKSATVHFIADREEDAFFKKLLPVARKIDTTCRYTSIDGVFLQLRDLKQNMCNVVCMNDRSEGIYADRFVFGNVPDINEKAFTESDHCYILSMMDTAMVDNLTMWRLYGDEAKGACIRYALRSKMNALPKDFFLAKVSYGEKVDGQETHKELELLRLIHQFSFGGGWRFKFNRWGIWKHFFKSYLFKDEREIRLLFYDRNDDRCSYEWIKNNDSQIVTKMQRFPLNDFPFAMEELMIGPKCSEIEIISRQLQHMAKSKGLDLHVGMSEIRAYR